MKPGTGTDVRHHDHLRTSCGRDLTIGRLALGDAAHPAGRVFIDLGKCRDCDGSTWAGLSVAEARRLASALLSQAAAAEQDAQDLPGRVTVRHVDGDAYAIAVRGHGMLTDQAVADGGKDAAATPTELLVASLASCVAFYTGRYLVRHGLDRAGLAVTAEFAMAAGQPGSVPSGCGSPCQVACRRSAPTRCSPWPRTAPCTTPCASNLTSASNSPEHRKTGSQIDAWWAGRQGLTATPSKVNPSARGPFM